MAEINKIGLDLFATAEDTYLLPFCGAHDFFLIKPDNLLAKGEITLAKIGDNNAQCWTTPI